MTDIKSMNMEELKELMTQIGEKPFRAKQIYGWLHEHLVTSYDEMANIPKSLKEKLKDYPITALEELDVQTSKVDGTRKYLFRLSDGNMIESVLMRYKYGNSVCISSQAGCRIDVYKRQLYGHSVYPYVGIIQIRLRVETKKFPLSRLKANSPVFIYRYII